MAITRMTLAVTAVVAAAALAGCGGGSGSGSSGETTASSAETTASASAGDFAEQGNAACERGRGGVVRRAYNFLKGQRSGGRPPAEVYAEMIKAVLLPAVEREMEWLGRLDPSPKQKAHVEALFAANRVAIKEVEGLKQVASMATVEPYFAHASKLARADGLTACANSWEGVG
jgi:hypothetical protein